MSEGAPAPAPEAIRTDYKQYERHPQRGTVGTEPHVWGHDGDANSLRLVPENNLLHDRGYTEADAPGAGEKAAKAKKSRKPRPSRSKAAVAARAAEAAAKAEAVEEAREEVEESLAPPAMPLAPPLAPPSESIPLPPPSHGELPPPTGPMVSNELPDPSGEPVIEDPFTQGPTRAEGTVRSYLDANGRPVMGIVGTTEQGVYQPGLDEILKDRVAKGDASDWDSLSATIREAAIFRAEARGVNAGDAQKAVDAYLQDKHTELIENQKAAEAPERPADWHPGYDGPVYEHAQVELSKGTAVELFDKELVELNKARSEFVKLSVKRRGISIGSRRKLNAAKKNYDAARNAAGQKIAAEMVAAGVSAEEVKALGKAASIFELHDLAKEAVAIQEKQAEGKKLKGFYDWWARQGGRKADGSHNWRGKATKAAALAAIGFVPGIGVAALAGGILASTGAGAVVGAAVASRISRGLLSAKINKEANAPTMALKQAEHLTRQGTIQLNGRNGDVRGYGSEATSDLFHEQTKKINKRNKWRHVGAVAMAAGGAAAGYGLHELMTGGGSGHGLTEKSTKGPKTDTPKGPQNPIRPKGPQNPNSGTDIHDTYHSNQTVADRRPILPKTDTHTAPPSLDQIPANPNLPSHDVVFTITDKWENGDATPWSWAGDQGIPDNKIPGFLSEVMGPDWSEAARHMQIGDSISASPEQIAKYIDNGELPATA